MNLLITGATGFIGGRLVERIQEQGDGETNVILLTSQEIRGFRCILHKNYMFTEKDFYQAGVEQVDAVIHLGHFLREKSNLLPVEGNYSSISNTRYLLTHLPNMPKHFVYCSSMAVYGEDIPLDYEVDESSPLIPNTAYSASKIFCEMMVREWAEKNGVIPHILRLSHIYGPRDARRYSLTVFLRQAALGQPIILTASPGLMRNYLYIDDCCDLIRNSLLVPEDTGVINVASARNASMGEVLELIRQITDCTVVNHWSGQAEGNGGIMGIRFKNNDKCRKYLGEEKVTLEEGLRREFLYYASMGE